jgi:uncharacterized protein YfaS (alpha-2-macroglobulin family)
MNRIRSAAAWISRVFNKCTNAVIGDFSWRPPGWLSVIGRGATRHPIFSFLSILAVISVLVACWSYYKWYEHQPKPRTVSWIANLPEASAPGDQFQPQNLTITFDKSVARLDSIGKEVKAGVTLSPQLKGKWSWVGGTQLVFEPAEDWPAATIYHLRLTHGIFAPHTRLDAMTKEFHTPAFSAAISDLNFYVSPKDPTTKQITAAITFSHPVDRASLEKNLSLTLESGEDIFKGAPENGRCTVTYDKLDRIAYVRSVKVELPKESEHATLSVPDSVVSALGHAPLEAQQDSQVLVPSLYALFHVDSFKAIIATNREGDPEQALILTTSVGVKDEDLAKAIHAWILPKKKSGDETDAHDWKSAAEVDADVLARAKSTKITAVPGEQDYSTLHSFKLKVPENAYVYVEIDKGLESMGGFHLSDKFASVSQVPPYPREVRIMHDGSLLALSGERKLSIESRGVEELEYRLGRVTPTAINHLVSQSEGSFQSPVFNDTNFDETNITEQIIRTQNIADTDTSKNDYSALDFSEFLKDSDANHGKLGLFFLRVLARTGGHGDDNNFYKRDGSTIPDPKAHPSASQDDSSDDPYDPTESDYMLADRRLILVTDLGLLIKDNADDTHDVFVQSIKTGEPVGGAKIDVLGKNGLPVVSAETDDSGRATLPSLQDFKREKKPVAYVVRKDEDVSFLPFGREDRLLNFSRFDTSGVTGLGAHDLTAFVFTDRGIYRPGDEAKIGMIIKQRDWRGKLDGVPLRLDVVDPRGTVVQSRPIKLNSTGFLEAAFPTRETSATGKYQVNVYLVKGDDDETLLGSQTLRVAEFLPDRMKIKATLSATSSEGWVVADGLKGLVALQNLYGTPSVGHRVTGKVTLNPSQFSFTKYPDYSFTDPYLNPDVPRKSHDEDLPEQTTDDAGNATFDLSMANLEPSAYRLSFLAEGFEKEGGRSVTAGSEVLVSPRSWLVGVKPDGDFSYVHLGSQRTVKFLAVDPQLKPVSEQHLKLKLTERRYVSVLVQRPNGNYAYQSVLKEIPVSEAEVAIPEAGLSWPLVTSQPGDFAARLYDEKGDLVADVRYSVAGTGNLTRSLEKNAELTAKLSKQEYQPGEEIEVEITAPYTGAGLLTIERDKVYAHVWFQAKTTSTVQKITLPKDFEGNGYLNVAFVRALDSKEIYMSPLSYAVLPFKVNQEARHTHIAIQVPKLARPGEPLKMQVTASRPTQAVVYAVDEGILQVARYTLPDPLGYFFRKQALEVDTRQTVDLILPEYSIVQEVAAAGGDADDDALAHHLNPFKRKHDAPVAFWSGIVDIGPQAKTFTYNVPDYFSGTIRVMVVTNTPDAVGSEQATTQVRGPFVISPNVPTFVAPGDTFDVSSSVANNIEGSGPNASVHLDIQVSDGLEIVQKPADTVTIAEGRDTSVHWLLKAKDNLGDADITITAESGEKKTSLASHLSIRPPVPYLTTLTSGYFHDGEKQVPVTRKLYPQLRKVSALASDVPQGLTRGLGLYLEHYEYGCTEQLTSKAFPSLVTSDTMQQGLSRTEVAKKVQEIIDVISTRQNDQGAIGYWTVTSDARFDLPSVHAMHFLTEAKEQGYDVPSDLMTHGLNHLQQIADDTADNFGEARLQAYAVYLLARNGIVVTNALEHNRDWFESNAKDTWGDDIADVYEASTYALLKDQDQADALIKRFHLRDAKLDYAKDETDFYNELGRSAQYIYLLSRHFPERAKNLTGDDLMSLANPIMDGDYNTLSAAQAILALDSYARMAKDNSATANVEIDQMVGGVLKKLDLTSGAYPESSFDADTDALVFKKGGDQAAGLFYQIIESGFDRTTVTEPMSEGIEVSREYQNKDGQVVTSAKLGEELNVVLRVRSANAQELSNVAIEDLLPGGFEVVAESVHTGACSDMGGIEYEDVREDRLLAFGTVSGTETEIKYRIKATNLGTYAVPPVQAESMYHQKIRARGVSGSITVGE